MNAISKPPFTQSLAFIKANDTLPAALLLKLLSENRSFVGLAVRESTGITVEKFDDIDDDTIEKHVKEFSGILDSTKKFDRLFCFGNCPEEWDGAEVQPWVILKDSKDKPLLVIAVEGDLPDHTGDGKTSEPWNYVREILGPKVEEMYSLLGNDPTKLITWLKSSGFKKDLEAATGHRVILEVLPATGDAFMVGKNEIGIESSWGRVSNAYGYTDSAIEAATPAKAEAPAAPEKKRSKYATEEPAAPAVKPAVAPATTPAPAIPKVSPPAAGPIAAAAEKNGHWEDVPRNIHGKKKKAFIRGLCNGELPPKWDNMTRVWVTHTSAVSSLEELPKLGVTANGVKDMKGDAPKPVVKGDGPVISGEQQAAANEFVKKYLDGSSNRIGHPLEAQKEEARYPVFSELMRKTMPTGLDDLITWPVTALKSFLLTHPELALLMVIELRRDRENRKATMAAGDKKLGELTGTEAPAPTILPASAPLTPSAPLAEPEKKRSKYA